MRDAVRAGSMMTSSPDVSVRTQRSLRRYCSATRGCYNPPVQRLWARPARILANRDVGLESARAESENDDADHEHGNGSTVPSDYLRDARDDDQDVREDGAVDAALDRLVAAPFRVCEPATDERAEVHPETEERHH